MIILVLNSGSSSLKYQLIDTESKELLAKGNFERIGQKNAFLTHKVGDEKHKFEQDVENHEMALNIIISKLTSKSCGVISGIDKIDAIGHRVVHGGDKFKSSMLVTDEVIKGLEECITLAPLHNPAHLMGIRAFQKEIPNALMVVCFDTAFHQTMREEEYLYPVPYEWYVKYNVRKYGFHGLSHQFVTLKMQELLNKENVNLIICHIGNGASVTAVQNSRCIDTSMGFTPNAGIMMGTRSGDIDYSILKYVQDQTGMSLGEIDQVLNKESGLQGIAGMCDLRDLDRAFEAHEQKAVLAFDMYTSRISEYIAKYYMKLEGKVDAICFTAGGGENDSIIRKETLKRLGCFGVVIDDEKNDETIVRKGVEGVITKEKSKIPCYVVATDEELMIARDTYAIYEEEN